ncbi:O-methyltransferase, partial [Klebsiella pneumoniae]|uniref:O-methyltransferase n=1 Tax=Klebsiella pneumoniae TaxID=573 RepID=UPI00248BD997
AEFVAEFDFYEDCIVWLDYTEPSKVGEQLGELEALVTKLQSGSVFKITMNAAAAALGNAPADRDLQSYRAERAAVLLGDYGPAVISTEQVTSKYFPQLLLSAIEASAKRGVAGRNG